MKLNLASSTKTQRSRSLPSPRSMPWRATDSSSTPPTAASLSQAIRVPRRRRSKLAMAATFLSTRHERWRCSTSCPRSAARLVRKTIRHQNNLQRLRPKRSQACSLSITLGFPGGPVSHLQPTSRLCCLLANSMPHPMCFGERWNRDTQDTSSSGRISMCTSSAMRMAQFGRVVGHPECRENRHVVGDGRAYSKGEQQIHPGLDSYGGHREVATEA